MWPHYHALQLFLPSFAFLSTRAELIDFSSFVCPSPLLLLSFIQFDDATVGQIIVDSNDCILLYTAVLIPTHTPHTIDSFSYCVYINVDQLYGAWTVLSVQAIGCWLLLFLTQMRCWTKRLFSCEVYSLVRHHAMRCGNHLKPPETRRVIVHPRVRSNRETR